VLVGGKQWVSGGWLDVLVQGLADAIVAPAGTSTGGTAPPMVVSLLSSPQMVPAGAGTYSLGQFHFDPSWVGTKSLVFAADARVSDDAETGTLVLWDLVADEAITGSLGFTGSLDFQHDSVTLTVGSGSGEVKLTARLYEVRATMSGAALGSRYLSLANVNLEVV
jgi:hypothetical protein